MVTAFTPEVKVNKSILECRTGKRVKCFCAGITSIDSVVAPEMDMEGKMAIFLDCFEPAKIKKAGSLGIISGVTTNPGLISHESKSFSMKQRIEKICDAVEGPVAVEVTASEFESMVAQAQEFYSWKPSQIVIKVPVSATGFTVITELERKYSIPTMATCVMTFIQAYSAALAGAHYIALFWGRMKEAGISPEETVFLLHERIQAENLGSRTLAASIRGPYHVFEALSAGTHIVTVSPEILEKIIQHPKTDEAIARFKEDWRCVRERGIMG
jgi:transaldolase